MTTITRAQIKGIRAVLGLSQEALAQALHVSRNAVKDWESGKFSPRPAILDELLEMFDQHDEDYRVLAAQPDPVKLRVPAGRPDGWGTGLAMRLTLDDREFDWDPVNSTALARTKTLLPDAADDAVYEVALWATEHRDARAGLLVTIDGEIVAHTVLPEQTDRGTGWVTTESELHDVAGHPIERAMTIARHHAGQDIIHITAWEVMP